MREPKDIMNLTLARSGRKRAQRLLRRDKKIEHVIDDEEGPKRKLNPKRRSWKSLICLDNVENDREQSGCALHDFLRR